LKWINCDPVPRETRNHPDELPKSLPHFRLIRDSSQIWRSG